MDGVLYSHGNITIHQTDAAIYAVIFVAVMLAWACDRFGWEAALGGAAGIAIVVANNALVAAILFFVYWLFFRSS